MSDESAVTVGFQRLDPRAAPPARATAGASGFDVRACLDSPITIPPGEVRLVPTGLSLAIPAGYEGQVRARSGLALRHGIAVLNGPGTIDSDYRGPLGIILANLGAATFEVAHGDRVAQLVIAAVPAARMAEVGELPPTDRGEGGFGHTGIR
jgi:dUTP pyrophosphatase